MSPTTDAIVAIVMLTLRQVLEGLDVHASLQPRWRISVWLLGIVSVDRLLWRTPSPCFLIAVPMYDKYYFALV
jgi:hypothetical protein